MLVQGVYAEDWHEIVINWYVDDFIDKSLLARASLWDLNNFWHTLDLNEIILWGFITCHDKAANQSWSDCHLGHILLPKTYGQRGKIDSSKPFFMIWSTSLLVDTPLWINTGWAVNYKKKRERKFGQYFSSFCLFRCNRNMWV